MEDLSKMSKEELIRLFKKESEKNSILKNKIKEIAEKEGFLDKLSSIDGGFTRTVASLLGL